MTKYYEDKLYQECVNDILVHDEFRKMLIICHHDGNRYDHSINVSFYSYKIAKFLHLDYIKVARAALLHDFFLEDNTDFSKKDKFKLLIKHPKYALNNSKKYFDLSLLEEDIILTHMFPIGTRVPKFIESWIVDLVDDVVAILEKVTFLRKQLSTAMYFLVIIFINYLD